MRLLASSASIRAVSESGQLRIQEMHAGEWWTALTIPLEQAADCWEEYQSFVAEEQLEPLTRAEAKRQLTDIWDQELIYPRGEATVIETIIERDYPRINLDRISTLLADNLFDWHAAIDEYLNQLESAHTGG